MIVDSGAGPNCISKDSIPEGCLTKRLIGPSQCYAANGEPMATSGLIDAWTNLIGYVTRTTFVICDDLPCPLLLGTNYMDQHIRALMPVLQEVELAICAVIKIMRKRINKNYMPSH